MVHVAGDLSIGLADVALIRVALRLLVASEETAQRTGVRHVPGTGTNGSGTVEALAPAAVGRAGGATAASVTAVTSGPCSAPGGRRPAAVSGEPGRSVEATDREQLVRGV